MKAAMKLTLAIFALGILTAPPFVSSAAPSASQLAMWKKLKRNASFSEDWSRYPSPDTILSTLAWQFPLAALDKMPSGCVIDTEDSHTTLGGNVPLTGDPAISNPNSGFIVWYMGCTKSFITLERDGFYLAYKSDAAKALETYMTPKMRNLCLISSNPSTGEASHPTLCPWSSLDVKARRAAIVEEIEKLIGPEDVIRDSGIAPSIEEFAKRIDEAMLAVLQKNPVAFNFIDVSSSAQPLEAVRAIRFMILMADTLKY